MKLKRILAMVLCVAMVLSTMSFNVFAEDDTNYVAQIGDQKFETVLDALTAAMESNTATEVKLLQDSTELLTTNFEFIVNSDVVITSDTPVAVSFYNNETKYDLVFGSENSNTITIDKNVTLKVEDRNIWLGYYSKQNVTVKVYGTLSAGYQLWSGSDVEVYGTLESLGEALVLRRGKTLTVDGGKVDANYFSILAGNIDAKNDAVIECGPVWISNTGSYANEGNAEIVLDNATLTSSSNLKSATTHADGVSITIMNGSIASFPGNVHGASQLDENTNLVVSGNSTQLNIKGLTNNGTIEVADGGKVSATGTVTNNGTIEVENEDDFEGEVSGNQPETPALVVAKVGTQEFASLAEAIVAAQDGDTIMMIANASFADPVTLPAGVTLNGNGYKIDGTVWADGDLIFEGNTKIAAFSASSNGGTITIGEGACLEITGTGRVTLGYGNVFNITGSIADAKTADKTNIQASLIIPGGISITGGSGAEMNVTNAYVKIGNTSSKNNAADGKFDLNFENSIAEFTHQFTLSEPTSGKNPTFEVNVKDSVLTTATKLCIAAPNTTMVIDNSTVNLGSYLRNSGELTLVNGSAFTGSMIQFGESGGNNGDIIVDGSTLTIKNNNTAYAMDGKGVGTLTLKNGAVATIDYIKDSFYSVDKTSTLNVKGLDGCEEQKETVAKIGNVEYATFEDAVANIKLDGSDTTIKLLRDIDTTVSTEFKYGKGNVIFTADEPVTVRQTALGKDWAFTTGNNMKVIVDENVTFEIYDNASGMYLYYGPSLELKGAITGGQNWGSLYLYKGSHTVAKTGKVNVGRVQLRSNSTEVKGEVDTNYLLVEGATFIADGAKIDANVIYDNNNGGQRQGASEFIIKNGSEVKTSILTLSYADSEFAIDATSSLVADKVVGAGKIVIDASAFAGNDVEVITADMSGFTGTIEVINNDSADYKIENGKVYIVSKKVAIVTDANGNVTSYADIESALKALTSGDTITLLADVELANTITVNKDVSLDLNGYTISGACNASQAHMFMVNNGAQMTIKDSSDAETGKITYNGTNATGWIVDVEGKLVLESGTLELTGTWSIGYAVDVRPNAWGSAYTEATSFVMNGGKIVSSDGGVRVASSSSETYSDISASFTMNGGEIDAAWDGVFVQQSNAVWDVLSFIMNGGTIKSGLNPVRFYGPAATSYVNGEDCVDIVFNGGILAYTGTEERTWLVENILRLGGEVTEDEFLKDSTVTASASFAETNVAEGYKWVESDGVYTLEKVKLFNIYNLTVSLDSSLALNIYYNSANFTGEEYYAEIKRTKADGTDVITNIPYADWVTSGKNKAIRYTGVAAKEMADRIAITIYNKDGIQVSETYETSLRDYAIGSLKQYSTNSAYAKYLPVYIDMLNYGAAAQKKFGYNLDNLANADTEEFQQYASQTPTIEDKEWQFDESLYSITVSLENTLELNTYFKTVTEDMYAKYLYTTHAGTPIEETVCYDSFIKRWGKLGVAVPVAIADAATLITVTLYNGDDTVVGKVVYSIDGYLKGMMKTEEDDIYPALTTFAASAKKAFAKNN